MRISRSTSYAILALGYITENRDKKIILSQDIARKYDIPLEYLLKLLQQMVKANILHSKRGPHGGFSLAKPPQNITMLQIIEAIEGPFISHSNLYDQAPGEKIGSKVDKIYAQAISQAKAVFQKAKLSTLVGK